MLLILVLCTLALFALFWGGSLIAQAYLYNEPADRLPIRALGAAALIAVFLTFWVWLDRRAPGKYGTFFEFTPYTTAKFDEFEAILWKADPASTARGKTPELLKGPDGKPAETAVKVRRRDGNRNAPFVTPDNKEFQLQGNNVMTGGLRVTLPGSAEPVRFDAEIKQEASGATVYASATDRRFSETTGSRYIFGNQLGVVYVPSTGSVIVALFVNLLHFVIWLAAIWLILRFTFGHALLFTFAFGLATMLLIMPLLFEPHRTRAAQAAPTSLYRQPLLEPGDHLASHLG